MVRTRQSKVNDSDNGPFIIPIRLEFELELAYTRPYKDHSLVQYIAQGTLHAPTTIPLSSRWRAPTTRSASPARRLS